MAKYYYKETKEFMVKNGFTPCFTDDKNNAILNAQRQSEVVGHTVYVDDIDGNCVARCFCGWVEA